MESVMMPPLRTVMQPITAVTTENLGQLSGAVTAVVPPNQISEPQQQLIEASVMDRAAGGNELGIKIEECIALVDKLLLKYETNERTTCKHKLVEARAWLGMDFDAVKKKVTFAPTTVSGMGAAMGPVAVAPNFLNAPVNVTAKPDSAPAVAPKIVPLAQVVRKMPEGWSPASV